MKDFIFFTRFKLVTSGKSMHISYVLFIYFTSHSVIMSIKTAQISCSQTGTQIKLQTKKKHVAVKEGMRTKKVRTNLFYYFMCLHVKKNSHVSIT